MSSVTRLTLLFVACGQKQAYAVAIEKGEGPKREQVLQSKNIAVPRHRGVQVAHLTRDLTNGSQEVRALSHRM